MFTVHTFLYTVCDDISPTDKRYFVAKVLNVDVAHIMNMRDTVLSDAEVQTLHTYCDRRRKGEPVDIIVEHKGFWTGDFYVNTHVLSPRPDTETLLCMIQDYYADNPPPKRILDMGTGSGCLCISLLHMFRDAVGFAVDVSTDALRVVEKNKVRNGVGDRCHTLRSDWWQSVPTHAPFDIIVSNPPYIPTADIQSLQSEVRQYDPVLALDGGADGLNPYRILANPPDGILNKDGIIVVECGHGQHDAVRTIFESHGWNMLQHRKDLGGITRGHMFQWG